MPGTGIADVLVNTHAHSAVVASFLREWQNGVRVTMVEEPELYGSAGTLRVNRKWVELESAFWVFYADVLTSADLNAMLRFHSPASSATLGVYTVPDPGRCGIVTVDDRDTVSQFVEKPAQPA